MEAVAAGTEAAPGVTVLDALRHAGAHQAGDGAWAVFFATPRSTAIERTDATHV